MDAILSTRNPSKIVQIKPIFAGLNLNVLSLADAGISGEAVEDGSTLEENALKKAIYAWERSGKCSMADDTGLFVDAFNGWPGVHSGRWAGDGLSTEEMMLATLAKLAKIPPGERTARFDTVAVLILPEGQKKVFTGSVRGIILEKPGARCQPNMPYSAIFVPENSTKVWADMSTEEENAVSHRGQALDKSVIF